MMFRNEVIVIGGWDYAIYLLATEDIFYAVTISSNPINDDFTFELDNTMLTKPLAKKSFIMPELKITKGYGPDLIAMKIKIQFQKSFLGFCQSKLV